MYTALRATSLTLSEFLQAEFEADPILRAFFNPAAGGTMNVTLNTPEEMIDLQAEGLSLWLYRVARDEMRLNAEPEREGPWQIRRTPLPVRLHYLVTPIVNERTPSGPETKHVVLGKTLQAFFDRPTLRGTDLQDDFIGTSVELTPRLEPLTLEEMARVWEVLEGHYQLSVSYEVTVIYIQSALQPADIVPVSVGVPEFGIVVR